MVPLVLALLAWLLTAVKLLGLFALVLVVVGLDIPKRWKLRHIPGPPALPFLGNLPDIIRKGSPTFFRECRAKFGPVFRVAFGRGWVVVVAEPELLRHVGSKLLNHEAFRSLMRPEFQQVDNSGLLEARDDYWRSVRAAWQPAFSASNLAGYMPRMVDCARQLAARLEGMAVRAEEEAAAGAAPPRVDMWRELGSMTLQVVGSTAYGVDFQAIEKDQPPLAPPQEQPVMNRDTAAGGQADTGHGGAVGQYGRALVVACQDFFRYSSFQHGSKYSRVAALLPEVRPLVRLLAHTLPDRPFVMLLQARRVLRDVGLSLITDWKAKAQAAAPDAPANGVAHTGSYANGAASDSTANANTNGVGSGEVNGTANGEATHGSATGTGSGVSPGSFLNLILSARDKSTGAGLTDMQVAAQVQTFILAGYETTANALAFAVYCLATNPDVESRMLQEIDSVVGGGRPPTEADLSRLPYTEAVFNEAMRLYPPAHATSRSVDTSAFQVGGYSVPAGTPIFMSIFSAHHNPDVWPRAEEFIPERFMPSSPLHPEVCARVPNAHAPFGYGSRMCVGWKFAVQEAKVALAALYQRLRFELEPGQVPLQTAVGITLSPRNGVWVRPVPRRPLTVLDSSA